jgi:hypothetical protein
VDAREVLVVGAKAILNGVSEASVWAGTQEQRHRLENMVEVTLCDRRHIHIYYADFPFHVGP